MIYYLGYESCEVLSLQNNYGFQNEAICIFYNVHRCILQIFLFQEIYDINIFEVYF